MKADFAKAAMVGKRARQEDFCDFYADNGAVLAVLADGMGGHAGGAEAAQTAVAAFIDCYAAAAKSAAGAAPPLSCDMLSFANKAIAQKAAQTPELAGMGCAFVAVVAGKKGMQWLSVGDCLLYAFANDKLQKLNADHSLGAMLDQAAAAGKIGREEAEDHAQRNALRSALTGGEIALVDNNKMRWRQSTPPLVVCASDGLLTLGEEEVANCLRAAQTQSAKGVAEALVAKTLAKDAPRQDNASVFVIKPEAA